LTFFLFCLDFSAKPLPGPCSPAKHLWLLSFWRGLGSAH
jgi:hypothetical protein